MTRRPRRRRVLRGLGAVAVSLGVAGCSSSDDGDSDSDPDEGDGTTDPTATNGPPSATESEPTASDTETEGSADVQLPSYTFSEGESYTYDATFGDGESEETWTVSSVDGDDVTVERTTVANGETMTQSVSGTHSDIFDEVENARDINYFPLLRGSLVYAQRGDLTAGNTFTIQGVGENVDWETATVDVVGETTVNGVTCTEFTVTPDSVEQVQTICLADGYPFALSLVYEQGGEVLISMALTDHQR